MTEQTQPSFLRRNYAGFIILASLLFGGTTTQGIWSDNLLYVAMIPAILIGFYNFTENNLEKGARILIVLILAIIALQFIPVSSYNILPLIGGEHSHHFYWTATVTRGLNTAIAAITALGFFLFLSTFDSRALKFLIKFIFIGLAINVLVTVIILSFSARPEVTGLLPYTFRLGLFSNENHFSSLTYLSIPLLAWQFLVKSWRPIIYVGIIGVLLLLQFAVDARAGMLIGSILAIASFSWAVTLKSSLWLKVTCAVVALIAVLAALFSNTSSVFDDIGIRSFYNAQVWKIGLEHWLTGTGLGSFFVIWPFYETKEIIEPKYIVHAHNDHLELFMELGIAYFLLLAGFLYLLLKNAFNSKLTQAATISIAALLIHSLVDFPLRTTGISICFAFLAAIVFVQQRPKESGV